MPRTCTVCRHPKREDVDRALLRGESLRHLEKRVGIPRTSLWRHKRHSTAALARAGEAIEIAHAGQLAEELTALIGDAHRLKKQAERNSDTVTALKAIHELCRLVELAAKVSGELHDRAQHNELHVHVPEEAALRIAQTFVERHRAKSKLELPAQLIEAEEQKP